MPHLAFAGAHLARSLRRPSLILIASILLFRPDGRSATAAESPLYDVVVYGGTPAGLIAAQAIRQAGASVIVVEPGPWLGGMVSGGLCRTDKGNERTIGGLARQYFERAHQLSGSKERWYLEPHTFQNAFRALIEEARIPTRTRAILSRAHKEHGRLTAIETADGSTFRGRTFIDASYEGDLMAKAGVAYRVGRESIATYHESLAGIRAEDAVTPTPDGLATVCACLGGEGPHYSHARSAALPARTADGRLHRDVRADAGRVGEGDGLTQAYNFRLTVTQRADLRVPFSQPKNYDPSRYELLALYLKEFPRARFGRLVHLGVLVNGKFDMNNSGFFSTDYIGGNDRYPDAEPAERERIRQDHVDYQQGFLWFLGHDPRVPADLRTEVNAWGLCRDEFVDNDHWPYQLYVREARRMIGQTVLTQHDLSDTVTKATSVAMGSFQFDSHRVQRVASPNGSVYVEGALDGAPKPKPYEIPYEALVPKASDCTNLLVPVCLSASHVAYTSLRMEPVYMALGHAAGLAAVMAARENTPVQDISVPELREQLKRQQQVLSL